MSFALRDYQVASVEAIERAWRDGGSTMIVLATGLGKTVVFAHVIARRHAARVLVLAHREELIWQAADKIRQVIGLPPEIEMAGHRARADAFGARVVVSSVQTQLAGEGGAGRMTRFRDGFDVLVIDEAHHAPAESYRRIIEHYRSLNHDLKVLGVTATPDRHDGLAMGSVFGSVAYEFGIDRGIEAGWLCPVRFRPIEIHGLDYSEVRTTAGDLNGADLSRVLTEENPISGIAHASFEEVGRRRALVFAVTVRHAELLCSALNRWEEGCAAWLCGKTPKDERKGLLADFAARRFRFLVNVGVLTEGFDDPGVEVVVMARPTKSRALYTQMLGRGTRTLPGVVDGPATAADRRAAIAASAKPSMQVIDFVGVSGRHSIVTAADVLAGKHPPPIVARAKEIAQRSGRPLTVDEAIAVAVAEEAEDRRKAIAAARKAKEDREAELARRADIRVRAKYTARDLDPFEVLDIERPVEMWQDSSPLTEKQIDLLERAGVDPSGLTPADGRRLCGEIIQRFKLKRCSYKQARILARNGYPTDVSREEASSIIDGIFAGRRSSRPAPELPPTVSIGGY